MAANAHAQTPSYIRPLRKVRKGALVLAFIACAIGIAASLFSIVDTTHAGTYHLPRVNIQARVMANGDLWVTEGRTFEFTDDINGVFWNIPSAQNEQGNASSLAITDVWVADIEHDQLSEAELRRSARPMDEVSYAESGECDVYTVNSTGSNTELKVFMLHEDGDEATVWVSYVLSGAVMAWPDTAELYWQFIGSEWEEDAQNVNLTLTFENAANGDIAQKGSDSSNFRAWGHGPLDGKVVLNTDDSANPTVTFSAPKVNAGQFAEARVLFPSNWVSRLAPSGTPREATVLEEEAAWAQRANAERERAQKIAMAGAISLPAAGIALLATTAVLRKTKYSSPKPVFQETYFRDLPSDDHPAVLGTFLNDGRVPDSAFVATLMKLTDERVIEMKHETRTEDRFLGLGERKVEEYVMRLKHRGMAEHVIDRDVIRCCFGVGARNNDEVTFDGMKDYAGKHEEEISEAFDTYKADILGALEERNLTDTTSAFYRFTVIFLAVMLIVCSVFFVAYTDGVAVPSFIAAVACSVVSILLAATAKCYSLEAVELRERCRALKRWLEDFTNLDEAVPSDLILWNKMLVMAVAFGVSEEVIRRLADAVPESSRVDESGNYYYPSYWWYHSHGHMHSPMHEVHSAYQATIRELTSSEMTSSAGGGGGFSGGGGGGVGGGGGGTF